MIFNLAMASEGALSIQFLETKDIDYIYRQNDRMNKYQKRLKQEMNKGK